MTTKERLQREISKQETATEEGGSETRSVGEVEDETDTDGLEEVGSGLVRDAGDGANAELCDTDVHDGKRAEVEAGEALVGNAVVDDDAAVLKGKGGVDAGIGGAAGVGAGKTDGPLDKGGKEFVAGGEGGAKTSHGGVEAAAGAGGGGVSTVGGGSDGAAEIDAEADAADIAEVVIGAASPADGGEGAICVGGEDVGGAAADGRVGKAAEVLGGDHAVDGSLGVGEGSKGKGEDGEERGFSEIHAAVSLAGLWGGAGFWVPLLDSGGYVASLCG